MKKSQPKLLSHATLRRPFIVTVSAVAALSAAACGGSTMSGDGTTGGGDLTETSNPPPPPATACPAAQPASGTSCSVDPSQVCGYKDCAGTPAVRAKCEGGAWDISVMSCNPPPPFAECPTEQPVVGGACRVAPAKPCFYKDCFGTPAVTATCDANGSWSISEMSCNPPPPPACPQAQPVPGTACTPSPLECGYKDCMGTPAVRATCGADAKWSVMESSCNPPPPPPPVP